MTTKQHDKPKILPEEDAKQAQKTGLIRILVISLALALVVGLVLALSFGAR